MRIFSLQTAHCLAFATSLFCLGGRAAAGTRHLAKPVTPPPSAQHALEPLEQVDHRFLSLQSDLATTLRNLPARGSAQRIAIPFDVDLGLQNAGSWEALSEGLVWRLQVTMKGALFLSFKFSQLDLPQGATLHFVSQDYEYADGPYGAQHRQPDGRFGSPMIPGDTAILELYLPKDPAAVALQIESVSFGFLDAVGVTGLPLRATHKSGTPPQAPVGPFSCQKGINCPEGAAYQDDKRAVAEGYDGSFICSGSLINNTRQDGRYLYITADHCGFWQGASSVVYYWNYENSTCTSNDAPLVFSTGSTSLFHSPTVQTDMNLLELSGAGLESTYNVYFLGWSRATQAPQSAALISFPADKPKQIAKDNDPSLDCSIVPCAGGFGTKYWRVTSYEVGVSEGGSSGGCMLNQHHMLVGVLTGGEGTNCTNFLWDEYSKLNSEWNAIKSHLDPDNTGVVGLAGKDGLTASNCQPILGFQGPGVASLTICGTGLNAGQQSMLRLSGVPANSPCYLLASLTGGINLPFKGGLIASASKLIGGFPLALATDGNGKLSLPVAGNALAIDVIVQTVTVDPAQAQGFSVSNAVMAQFGP